MFIYCGNNPINRADPSGTFWKEIGNFFKSIGSIIIGATKAIFGVRSSTTTTIAKTEVDYLPDPLPITAKTGAKTTQIVSKNGTSCKPVSVYANLDSKHPIKSSSAGLKLNISKFTLDIRLGLDDVGLYGSFSNSNTVNGIGIKANLSELKVGFEYSSSIMWDNTIETTYTNVSINGWALVAAYILTTTGQTISSPSYTY